MLEAPRRTSNHQSHCARLQPAWACKWVCVRWIRKSRGVVDGLLLKLSFDGHVAWDTKRCILRLSENMLPIAIFQCYFCGLFEATFVVTKKEIHIPRSRCNFVSVMFTTYTQEYIIYSSPFGCVFLFIAPEKRFVVWVYPQKRISCLSLPTKADFFEKVPTDERNRLGTTHIWN